MTSKSSAPENKKVSCNVCMKEVPLSEAKVAEAVDYVAHFCGLDCYNTWKKKSEKAGAKGGAAKKS